MRGKIHKRGSSSSGKGRGKRDDRKTRGRNSEENSVNNSVNNSTDEIEVDNVSNDEESKKYARRKIESNWDRFEEPEIDEHEVVVDDYDETKDYEYISQHSASASSHFRFKEEKEWEQDIQQSSKENKNVLGLNLFQLSGDLTHYGFKEKLGIDNLLPDECKYCIEDVFKDPSTRNSNHVPSLNAESTETSKKIQWSFNGIEKYKYLIGLTSVNGNSKLVKQQRCVSNISNGTVDDNEIGNYSSSQTSSYQSSELTSPSIDSGDESDNLLNQLLMSKISINNSTKMPVLADKGFINDNDLSHKNKRSDKRRVSEELDLDMLLESDILSSVSASKSNTNVDTDLDDWLDDLIS